MLLSELAACVGGARIASDDPRAAENTQIRGLTADSRFCSPGDLFFCLTGGKTDSHVYAADAEEAGAAAVVCERELALKIPRIVVPDSRRAMGLMAAAFYGRPADRLKIVGVTGTNGKIPPLICSLPSCGGRGNRWLWWGRSASATEKNRSRPS